MEECLIQDETYKTTEEINQISLSTDKQAEENINPSTDKEIDIVSTEEDTSQSLKNPDTTNKISEYSSEINENPIILSTPISEYKSTSNIPHITNSINVDKTQEESTILISSDYMV